MIIVVNIGELCRIINKDVIEGTRPTLKDSSQLQRIEEPDNHTASIGIHRRYKYNTSGLV